MALLVLIVLIVLALIASLRVVRQYERGVVLTLGRYSGTRDPGLTVLVPLLQSMLKADMRVMVHVVQPQDVITKDNVSVKVTAVVYFKIVDAEKALLGVKNYDGAIDQLAQITLRSTIGQHRLDEVLAEQDKLNQAISVVVDQRTHAWGIAVDHVEIRSVDLSADMIRAMAQEAEAERGARARVITARGEREAAEELAAAARILGQEPTALTLRSLATLKEIGAEQNTMILFPVAMETLVGPNAALAAGLARAVTTSPPAAAPGGAGPKGA